jgi:hypothetical protein
MVTEERVVNLESVLARFIEHTDLMIAAIHEDIAEIRASNARTDRQLLEMQQQAEKDRQQAERERQQAERERKDFNKRLAEISDSMGTLIEDMVAPSAFRLANAIFRDEEAQSTAIRVRRRQGGESMELDLLAIGPTKALVIEVKRRLDAGKVAEYQDRLKSISIFFPELAGKTVIGAAASVYLEPSVIALLNRQKLYGIAMGDEVMEVVNLGQF